MKGKKYLVLLFFFYKTLLMTAKIVKKIEKRYFLFRFCRKGVTFCSFLLILCWNFTLLDSYFVILEQKVTHIYILVLLLVPLLSKKRYFLFRTLHFIMNFSPTRAIFCYIGTKGNTYSILVLLLVPLLSKKRYFLFHSYLLLPDFSLAGALFYYIGTKGNAYLYFSVTFRSVFYKKALLSVPFYPIYNLL